MTMLLQTGGRLNSCSICLPHNHAPQAVGLMWAIFSLIPRPSHHPVFDCLQYAKMEGEGLVHFYHVNDTSVYCRMHFGQYQPHQLCWGDQEIRTTISCMKCSWVLVLFIQQVEAPCICHSLSLRYFTVITIC